MTHGAGVSRNPPWRKLEKSPEEETRFAKWNTMRRLRSTWKLSAVHALRPRYEIIQFLHRASKARSRSVATQSTGHFLLDLSPASFALGKVKNQIPKRPKLVSNLNEVKT